MDAVDFLNEGTRMCNSYEACVGCPMYQTDDCCMVSMNLKQMINIVEQWAKEHPIKTRQSEFLKMFPNAQKSSDGVLDICPNKIEPEKYKSVVLYKACINSDTGKLCTECKRDFWLKEIE